MIAVEFALILTDINSRGLWVNNLFQFGPGPNGLWQANLTDGNQCWEFARAGSPEGALELALAKTEKASHPTLHPGPQLITNADDLGL